MKIKISAAFGNMRLECSVRGILRDGGCGARCCKSAAFWPPSTNTEQPGAGCLRLGPNGCTLTDEDRPVTCLLYPFKLNKHNTLVLHHRVVQGSICGNCWKDGPPIIEALRGNLMTLFGAEAERIIETVKAGIDAYVEVPESIEAAILLEQEWEACNKVPKPRQAQAPIALTRLRRKAEDTLPPLLIGL